MRFQISGTFSISIQWYWTFSRSERSAVSRPNSVEMPPRVRSCSTLVSRADSASRDSSSPTCGRTSSISFSAAARDWASKARAREFSRTSRSSWAASRYSA